MSRIKLSVCVLLSLSAAACSLTEPFVDRRREAGANPEKLYVGSSKPDSPVICYNGWVTDFEKIQEMANNECLKNETGNYAQPQEQEFFVCRLLTPAVWKFKCINVQDDERNKS